MALEAIILAGGFGTRLKKIVSDVPKPMAPINGVPFLEYLLNFLLLQGIEKIILAVGFKYECIVEHFGTSYKGLFIKYSIENKPHNSYFIDIGIPEDYKKAQQEIPMSIGNI